MAQVPSNQQIIVTLGEIQGYKAQIAELQAKVDAAPDTKALEAQVAQLTTDKTTLQSELDMIKSLVKG